MNATAKKPLPSLESLIQGVLDELEGHPNRARFEELYDTDEALAGALNRLPGFEYPDIAHMDVKQLREHYTLRLNRAKREALSS